MCEHFEGIGPLLSCCLPDDLANAYSLPGMCDKALNYFMLTFRQEQH